MTENNAHILEVWGDLACFTRPELKVERWSYPCPTPSAARGVFDAIHLKPEQFRWQITRIELLRQPQYIALRRNEVSAVLSERNVQQWMKGSEPTPLQSDADNIRQQRQTMALRQPRYRLTGRIVPWSGHERNLPALNSQFRRRASQGKCFCQPCLGCREFAAFFRLCDDGEENTIPPASVNQHLGHMLYDVFDLSRPGGPESEPFISVFEAEIVDGVLEVPEWDDKRVLKPERSGR